MLDLRKNELEFLKLIADAFNQEALRNAKFDENGLLDYTKFFKGSRLEEIKVAAQVNDSVNSKA